MIKKKISIFLSVMILSTTFCCTNVYANPIDAGDYSIIPAGLANECDVTTFIEPSDPTINGTDVIKNVENGISNIVIDLEVSENAIWSLYSDQDCLQEISNKSMDLNVGENTSYIKVTAQDNVSTKIYKVIITRESENTEKTVGDYVIIDSDNGVEIKDYIGNSTDVTIPDTLDGKTVLKIGDFAFMDKNLTSVIIPNTVTDIGDEAFRYNNLINVKLGDNLKNIAKYAFYGKREDQTVGNQLTNLEIPDSVVNIGESAFDSNAIKYLKIGKGVIKIEQEAFEDNRLESIEIPDSVTEIGEAAFADNNLTNIKIGNGVVKIEQEAFSYNLLENLEIPDNVTEIGEAAFAGNKLTKIKIGNGLTKIGESVFAENQLVSIIIPLNVDLEENTIENGFKKYYDSKNKKDGEYKYNNGDWELKIKSKSKSNNSSSFESETINVSNLTTSKNEGVEIIVNGKRELAGKANTITENNRVITTIVIDQNKIEEKLKKEVNGSIITIPVNIKSDSVYGELNGQMIKTMDDKKDLIEIKTDNANYIIPAHQINIDNISKQLGENIELKNIKVKIGISKAPIDTINTIENIAKKENLTIVTPSLEFLITCDYGNKKIDIKKFDAYVERYILIPDGVDISKVTTAMRLEEDGTISSVPTNISQIDGKYYAKINSLTNSIYFIVWNPVEFRDIENHWAKDAINDMGARMAVEGIDKETFLPNRNITRAEFATFIVKSFGLKTENKSNIFQDVSENDRYSKYINVAAEYGIVGGYSNHLFKPESYITREEAMSIITRAINFTKLNDKVLDKDKNLKPLKFNDSSNISKFAKESVDFCISSGIVRGKTDKLIAPKDFITRAEATVIIQRILQTSNLINNNK